jgi:long-chain-fatty-acid--[acyl-carrier-protein] ligase
MCRILRYLLWAGSRLLLALRYRWTVYGLEALRDTKAPVLVLPNHPAYIDPMLVYTVLYPQLGMRPMVFAGNFNNPAFRLIKRLLDAHDIPDLNKAGGRARAEAERAIGGLIDGLKKGVNHCLWPAGHTQHHGVERLGAARASAEVLRSVPDTTVVLVRTRGLWGSSFSWAYTGEKPPLTRRFLAGAGVLLANLIVFMPRRRIEITVRRVDRSDLPPLTREELNPWLERWYNEGGPEAPSFAPYHFLFGPRTREYPEVDLAGQVDLERIKPQTIESVGRILADKLRRLLNDNEQAPDTSLDELGLDSIDRVEIALRVERQFGVTCDKTPETLGQLWMMAEGLAGKAPSQCRTRHAGQNR